MPRSRKWLAILPTKAEFSTYLKQRNSNGALTITAIMFLAGYFGILAAKYLGSITTLVVAVIGLGDTSFGLDRRFFSGQFFGRRLGTQRN